MMAMESIYLTKCWYFFIPILLQTLRAAQGSCDIHLKGQIILALPGSQTKTYIFYIFSKMNLIWYQKTCQTSDQKPNWPFIEKWRMREGTRKLVHFFSFIDFYCLWQMNCKETVQNPWQEWEWSKKYWNKTMFAIAWHN